MVKTNNFFVVHEFMINDLDLKGNELFTYSIIYGFSQTEGNWFTGSIKYIAHWLNSTPRTVYNVLEGLVAKKLIVKKTVYKNNVKYCQYRVTYHDTGNTSESGDEAGAGADTGTGTTPESSPAAKPEAAGTVPEAKPEDTGRVPEANKIANMIEDFTGNTTIKTKIYDVLRNRKKANKPTTTEFIKIFLEKLQKFSNGDDTNKIKILDYSIEHGYITVYPLATFSPKQSQATKEPTKTSYNIEEFENGYNIYDEINKYSRNYS